MLSAPAFVVILSVSIVAVDLKSTALNTLLDTRAVEASFLSIAGIDDISLKIDATSPSRLEVIRTKTFREARFDCCNCTVHSKQEQGIERL